jgi:hypothetical protein
MTAERPDREQLLARIRALRAELQINPDAETHVALAEAQQALRQLDESAQPRGPHA